MRKIRYSYHPDRHQVGTEDSIDDDRAATLVREGRAIYLDVDPEHANVASAKVKAEPQADTDATDDDGEEEPAKPRKAAKKAADKPVDTPPAPEDATAEAGNDGPAPGTGDTPAPAKATKSTRS